MARVNIKSRGNGKYAVDLKELSFSSAAKANRVVTVINNELRQLEKLEKVSARAIEDAVRSLGISREDAAKLLGAEILAKPEEQKPARQPKAEVVEEK